MRIAVLGATGKVGRELVAQIEAAPDLHLAEAIGSGGGGLAAARLDADLLVDFSTPDATMALLDRLAGDPLPLVIGTTGFSVAQAERLAAEGARRPILVAANFTFGFQPFRAAALALARALPEARITVSETYGAAKKPAASGTTRGLVADLAAIRPGQTIATGIFREGACPGINEVSFDAGVVSLGVKLTVASRAAYAAGALAAARWLTGRAPGAYTSADMHDWQGPDQ